MKKEAGNVANLLVTGICVLAMTLVMALYLDCVRLIRQKTEISQLARKYILLMETTGELTPQWETSLYQELESMGVTEIDLAGTTVNAAPYSTPISLEIRGKLGGKFAFEERRVSTSKN